MTPVFASPSHKDDVYQLMLDRIDCGPFDGGCLIFALALQKLHGGDVVVVEGRCFSGWSTDRTREFHGPLMAQHAVLSLADGTFMDASGSCSRHVMLARTAKSAQLVASAESIRPMEEDDLKHASRDETLVAELVLLLAQSPRI